MSDLITDEMVTAVALAIAEEVRSWPADASLPYDPRVGVGTTFHVLARVGLEAAVPLVLAAERRRLAQIISEATRGEQR
jgi:hypothetical protein